MIESLLRFQPSAEIVVFAFDDKCCEILRQLNLVGVKTVPLVDFEDEDLKKVKGTRSTGEYCWTATPSTVLHCLTKLNVRSVTYVDADLCFYSDPSFLFKENERFSIWITSHRYSPMYDQSKTSGKYCVQFVHFKNNDCGIEAAKWWRDRCIEWCYSRYEDGKFGDQKYLDDWLTRFQSVIDIPNIGVGVAPWNMGQYEVIGNNLISRCVDGVIETADLVFFHFHGFQIQKNGVADLGYYQTPKSFKQKIYRGYFKAVHKWDIRLLCEFGVLPKRKENLRVIKLISRWLKGTLNLIAAEKTG